MRNLSTFIKEENEKCYLRNLFIEINEELRKLISTEHSKERKDQFHNNSEDINVNEIKEIINKCDNLIINKLLNNEIKINSKEEQFGILKIGKGIPYKSFMCIFEVVYFNELATH